MDLKRTLELLSEMEADGKLVDANLPGVALYDPNNLITLTVRAVDAATREQFIVDAAALYEPEAEAVEDEPEVKHTAPVGVTKKKAAKKK